MGTIATLAPLRAAPLRENVAEVLIEKILTGGFQPGDRLNESELSRQLQVSRAPIREALQHLQEQGLVIMRARRGAFVVKLSESDIRKINELRVVLEAEALVLFRQRANRQAVEELRGLLERMEDRELPALDAGRLDLAFHRAIWSNAGNEFLERALTSVTSSLFSYALVRRTSQERMRMILDSHRPLFDFLLSDGDAQAARQVMTEHLNLRWPAI